jgi:hypothetical protein
MMPATSPGLRLQSTAGGLPTPDPKRRSAPEGVSYFDVDGYPLAYREQGSGPPLILIHGSVNDYRAWGQQLPVFAQRRLVIVKNAEKIAAAVRRADGQWRGVEYAIEIVVADTDAQVVSRWIAGIDVNQQFIHPSGRPISILPHGQAISELG